MSKIESNRERRETHGKGFNQYAAYFVYFAVLTIPFSSCRQDMHDQPKYKPMEASRFFSDGQSSRPPIPGTVPYRAGNRPAGPETPGTDPSKTTTLPFAVTLRVLDRGEERFNIYCAPCHGRLGLGQGMVVRRGFRAPPSFHSERLREAPVGHFYDVMTNGFGAMPSYADKLAPDDRWAIAAYIRALQLSQHATLNDVPPPDRDQILQDGQDGQHGQHGQRGQDGQNGQRGQRGQRDQNRQRGQRGQDGQQNGRGGLAR